MSKIFRSLVSGSEDLRVYVYVCPWVYTGESEIMLFIQGLYNSCLVHKNIGVYNYPIKKEYDP